MSLFDGMNASITANERAMEEANEQLMDRDEAVCEADELIDFMVDGISPIAMESSISIDQMLDEEEEADELERELAAEECGCRATEATGNAWLATLSLDKDDPIKTVCGSIGQKNTVATHDRNFADSVLDADVPFSTYCGSIGQDNTVASYNKNYSDGTLDDNDPIKTYCGSIGQKNTSAKDKAVESAMFFGMITGQDEAVTESVVSKFKDSKRANKLALIGVSDYDREGLKTLLVKKKFSQAKNTVNSFITKLNAAKKKAGEDAKKIKAVDALIKYESALLLGIEVETKIAAYVKSGMNEKEANKKVIAEMKAKAKSSNPATESFVMDCLDLLEANEAMNEMNPELTEDGSIGQDNTVASYNKNYSDGALDDNDPIKTTNGGLGSDDIVANYDKNYSDWTDDDDDPISTSDDSVGPKTSTAKDPAAEGSTSLDDELSDFTDELYDDDDDDVLNM